MRRGRPITIYDRTKLVDFTYIDDCIRAFLLGIDKLLAGEVVNETINLSSGSPASLLQVAETIAAHLKVTPQIIDEPLRPGEINFYVADLSKAKALLGYEPQAPFEEGLRRTIEWSLAWQENNGG
jgi:nucleoside-diphosphate-sugar epimerase